MNSVQGPVTCRAALHQKWTGVYALPVNGPLTKIRIFRSGLWGSKGISCTRFNMGNQVISHKVKCSFSSSSNGNGRKTEYFSEGDADYVNSSVVEAVEVKSSADGFMIKMRDGQHLKCAYNNPQSGQLPDYAPHPAIVLKMEDGTDLLLPIVVLELPSTMLMAAMGNVQIARPTMYQVVMEMVDKMGYEVKLVRVTKRVDEAYFAQIYLKKLDDNAVNISFELRPSDAINIAVRCKVPIQVNKLLAHNDGMRVVESTKLVIPGSSSASVQLTKMDRPSGKLCIASKEFSLLRNMQIAADEGRYADAAQWREKLKQYRSRMDWT